MTISVAETRLQAPGMIFQSIAIYGFIHFLVDAACYYILLGLIDSGSKLMVVIMLYNLLAFGLQPLLGFLSDHLHKPVICAFLGCMVICPAFYIPMYPVTATILAGVGNALFHVGGGTVSLNLRPGKAALPGLFVAPGGLGLFAGSLLVKYNVYTTTFPVILLTIMAITLLFLKQPVILRSEKETRSNKIIFVPVLLLLFTICIRSGAGFAINYPWKSGMIPGILFITAIALGKGTGGYLADRFGWIKITFGGLTVSAFLLFFGTQNACVGLAGVYLLNVSMPVTLTAISNLLPGKPGFSFGLTTLALLLGSMPALLGKVYSHAGDLCIGLLVLISASTLLWGLILYKRLHIRDKR